VLTYRCNLRCVMCYAWGNVGWCHDGPRLHSRSYLCRDVIRQLINAVGSLHPHFILHGGEPLL
jgi:MoaA/NifB/PqqE/SkfB family radical SAM enzyme